MGVTSPVKWPLTGMGIRERSDFGRCYPASGCLKGLADDLAQPATVARLDFALASNHFKKPNLIKNPA
jgi:hypothetical protein